MKSLNNKIRRSLKTEIKKIVEKRSNNKVVKIVLINESNAQCHCTNKYNNDTPHMIEIVFNKKIIMLIYEDCIFTQVML